MHAIALTTLQRLFYIRGNSLISSWLGVITSIWLYSLKNLLLFSVALYICSLSSYFSKPFSTMRVRYSFSCAYGRNALYIILAWVAPPPPPSPPPFAASSICATMSVRLLYLIAKHSTNDVNEHYGAIFCKQKPIIESFMLYYSKSLSLKACWLLLCCKSFQPPPSITGRAYACFCVSIALDIIYARPSFRIKMVIAATKTCKCIY
jgi:hypothetical protein